jgi:membrane associated rhomboid family serine protease
MDPECPESTAFRVIFIFFIFKVKIIDSLPECPEIGCQTAIAADGLFRYGFREPIQTMDKETRNILWSFVPGLIFVAALWAVYAMELYSGFSLAEFGVRPRDPGGLKGIITSPFLHGDLKHLTSNSVPMLVLLTGLIYFYRQLAAKVLLGVWLLGGFWLWLGGRDSYHIGASGLIYGLTAFLFFSGVFRRDTRLMALSMLVVFLYGGMVWGLFPLFRQVSWEAHLFGAVAGLMMAWVFRTEGPQKKVYEWELEEDDTGDEDAGTEITDDGTEVSKLHQNGQMHIHYIYRPQHPPTENPEKNPPSSNDEKN